MYNAISIYDLMKTPSLRTIHCVNLIPMYEEHLKINNNYVITPIVLKKFKMLSTLSKLK